MNNAYIRAQQCKVKEAKFPFVKIGEQYWTTKNLSLTVTPQGNTIREVQANGNVEKVVNGGFDTDTNWVKGTGWTISGGVAIASNVINGVAIQQQVNYIGWVKLSLYISNLIGAIQINIGGAYLTDISTTGTYTRYVYLSSVNNIQLIGNNGLNCSIDNVSVQQIGWSGSQELYDGIYAQTSGTVEQKTYAAVKAAAMWCRYNNDVAIGAIYGKLYNWFAVKLFQMDIDYYNAANPTKPYIWRVPTQAEFATLSTYLGGDAVSGGHLKEAGLAHWASPNTGADNSSGFSAIGGANRNVDGSFSVITSSFRGWTVTGTIPANAIIMGLSSADSNMILVEATKVSGRSIRLIKA